MKRYEFHSALPPEELLDDLQEWLPVVGAVCRIDRRKGRIKLWSRHTALFNRGQPFTIFCACITCTETGSRFRGRYRPAIPALISNTMFNIWSIVLLGAKGAAFSLSLTILSICIDLWDNRSERRRVILALQERYPIQI